MVSYFQRKQYQSHHRRPLHRAPGMGQGTTPDVSPHSPQATSLPTQKTQIKSISQPSDTLLHTLWSLLKMLQKVLNDTGYAFYLCISKKCLSLLLCFLYPGLAISKLNTVWDEKGCHCLWWRWQTEWHNKKSEERWVACLSLKEPFDLIEWTDPRDCNGKGQAWTDIPFWSLMRTSRVLFTSTLKGLFLRSLVPYGATVR